MSMKVSNIYTEVWHFWHWMRIQIWNQFPCCGHVCDWSDGSKQHWSTNHTRLQDKQWNWHDLYSLICNTMPKMHTAEITNRLLFFGLELSATCLIVV